MANAQSRGALIPALYQPAVSYWTARGRFMGMVWVSLPVAHDDGRRSAKCWYAGESRNWETKKAAFVDKCNVRAFSTGMNSIAAPSPITTSSWRAKVLALYTNHSVRASSCLTDGRTPCQKRLNDSGACRPVSSISSRCAASLGSSPGSILPHGRPQQLGSMGAFASRNCNRMRPRASTTSTAAIRLFAC